MHTVREVFQSAAAISTLRMKSSPSQFKILIALWEAKQVWSFATSVRTLSPASFKIPDAFLRAIGASEVRCVYECGGVALRDVCTEPVTKDHIRQCVGNLEGQCRSGKGAHAHKGTLFIR